MVRLDVDDERFYRAMPFAVVGILGQGSAAWPPGPSDLKFFWVSSALLLLAGTPIALAANPHPNVWLGAALTYVGSVAFLMLATGGVTSGLGALLLIPVVALALYGRRGDSLVGVTAVMITLLTVSLATPHVDAATARRALIFGAVGAMLSYAVHALRDRNSSLHERLEQQATVEERRRIARELHDGLAHELAFIASKAKRAGSAEVPSGDFRELAGAADRALDEARRAITLLTATRPQPLTQAVAQTAEDLAARLGMEVRVDVVDEVETPGQVTEHLLRIVREAITNAANHGRASRVVVRLERTDVVRLCIDDDGCGFDPRARAGGSGFGLLSMEERAAAVGARFGIDSTPGRGTRIEVVFG